MTRPRVLIADDHPVMRMGIASALEDGGLSVCAQAADAAGAIEQALRERPDVCLLDVNMPGGGIHAATEISAALPETAVVMLTISDRDDDLFAALRAGVSGYLLKDTTPDELPESVRAVLRGEGVVAGSLVIRMIDDVRARGRRRPWTRGHRDVVLTEREWQVVELLYDEKTTEEISDALSISKVTVRRHISDTVRKLQVRDRNELLRLVRDLPDTEIRRPSGRVRGNHIAPIRHPHGGRSED